MSGVRARNAAARHGKEKYVFRLFVAGMLPNSARAIENIKAIFTKYLAGRYKLKIIDLYKRPSLASIENIIVLPMLIKECPLPEERLIGDMSNTENVLKRLNLLIPG